VNLRAERNIEWAVPAGCPDGLKTVRVYAGRSAPGGGSPIELAVARWAKQGRVSRGALRKLHGLRVNKRATPVVLNPPIRHGALLVRCANAKTHPRSHARRWRHEPCGLRIRERHH